ncbi:DNA-binding transcriptional regulator, XRE-family HTH domain [Sinosporangium album]|uniref:DNA-binding transcriptional regulator, XRE-family HTH domain n=1 Tax=Sinosporangium album TaxID=504805 RepID=A0A1G8LU86_9ACTN|nr:helix-turn-helix transcriptional regulator [Sinosporangium album]SDI59259.1 DNA-binding transcriptional regulator, XRE-family HTH domain [Sinosporangium album]
MPEINTGDMIRLERERRGLNTISLATQAGCTPRYIELIENGKRTPSLPLLRSIAKALGVRTAMLLGEHPRDDHQAGRPQLASIERAIFTYRTLGPNLEPPTVEQLQERVHAARDAWFTSPHRYTLLMRVLPGLISDAERLVLDGGNHRDACRVASDTYILSRGVLKHLGRVDLAHLAADRAMRYAEETGDALMIGWAHWCLGQSMLSDDMHEVAYDVARRGIELFEPAVAGGDDRHLSVLGALNLMASIGLTRSGGGQEARDILRGEASRLAARLGNEQANHFGLAFGPTNVAIHMTSIECETHNAEAALRVAEEIDLTRVPSVERRTTHLFQVARACGDLGDDAASLLYLMRIERECPEELDHKMLLRDMVRSMAVRAPRSWAPEVRYLAERHNIHPN